MNKGERAIAREERRLEKERKRRIELANKMLIPTGGKTRESLDLISFDPSGVFRFGGDRFMVRSKRSAGSLWQLATTCVDTLIC